MSKLLLRSFAIGLPVALSAVPALAAGSVLTNDQMVQFSQSLQGKDCQDPTVMQSAQIMHADDPGVWSRQTVNAKNTHLKFTLEVPFSAQWSVLGESLYAAQWTSQGISVGPIKFFKDVNPAMPGCVFDRTYHIASSRGTLAQAIQRFDHDRAALQSDMALPVVKLTVGSWKAALIPSITPAHDAAGGSMMSYDALTVEANGVLVTLSRTDHRLDGNLFRMGASIEKQ